MHHRGKWRRRRRCATCGAAWRASARWCGSCGAVLDPASTPAGHDSATGEDPSEEHRGRQGAQRRRRAGSTAGATLLVLILLVAGGPLLLDVDGDGHAGDDLPAVEDGDVGLPDRDTVDDTGTDLACSPSDCEIWRVKEAAGGVVVASADLVVHLGQTGTAAYDARDGQPAWERDERHVSTTRPVAALSEHGLAFVVQPSPAPSPEDDDDAFVRVLAPEDGEHRGDVEVALHQIFDLAWVHDPLVVMGQAREDFTDGPDVVVVSPDGQTHWRHEGEMRSPPPLLTPGVEVLALQEPGEVVGRALYDGDARWRVRGQLAFAVMPDRDLLVLDGDAGEARLVDREDGQTQQRFPAQGADGVGWVGPWVVVSSDEPHLHLLGPDGQIVVRHAPRVASLDPLIVHGMGGILRLDPDLLGSRALGKGTSW